MNNVYLFQPQYAVEFREEVNYWLPYSAGCLWSYLSKLPNIKNQYRLDRIFFKRDPIEEVLAKISNPSIVGFSCYLWNEQYCLAAAEAIKNTWPNCLIIFGGTQTTLKTLDNKFVDTVVIGEGEQVFAKILDLHSKNLPIEQVYTAVRIDNLEIESPYLSGVFDSILEENPNTIWAMTLETNRGCPYACSFCDWGGTTFSKVKKFNLERIAAELDWAKNNNVAYIFCADANFGIFRERDLEIAKLMRLAADNSRIEAINLQYAKNSTEAVFEIAKTIGPYGRGITVSVQSMNQPTLEAIHRQNLKTNNISELMRLSEEYQIGTYTEVILGLPCETEESWRQGLCNLLELGQHQSIDIWFAQLLEGSELASDQSRRKYKLQSIWVKDYVHLNQLQDPISEHTEIINATNTMTTDEMVECYMYAWMIIQVHIAGYSQVLARYARTVKKIQYRQFYDMLYQELQTDNVFQEHFLSLKTTVKDYLYHGILPDNCTGGHAIHSQSYKFLYNHRLAIIDVCKKIIDVTADLEKLQQKFIFTPNSEASTQLQVGFNIYSGTATPTKYTINTQIKELSDDFYTVRRKGLHKNLITI